MTACTRTFRLAVLAALAALVLVLVPAALAAKGSGKKPGGGGASGGGSIGLAPLVTDLDGNGVPNYGDTVMFEVSTTATTQPYVHLQCYQNGSLVAEGWRGYFDGSLDYPYFGLYGGSWSGGAADCIAYLVKGSTARGWTTLASTSLHVDA